MIPEAAPNTTDWVIAGSSVAAAIGTVLTLGFSISIARRQVMTERAAQARRVDVLPHQAGEPFVTVVNNSDETIRQVLAVFYDAETGASLATGDEVIAALGHGERVLLTSKRANANRRPLPDGGRAPTTAGVGFIDGAEVQWFRDRYGKLRERARPPRFTWVAVQRIRWRWRISNRRWSPPQNSE